jgi:hypothetical protein
MRNRRRRSNGGFPRGFAGEKRARRRRFSRSGSAELCRGRVHHRGDGEPYPLLERVRFEGSWRGVGRPMIINARAGARMRAKTPIARQIGPKCRENPQRSGRFTIACLPCNPRSMALSLLRNVTAILLHHCSLPIRVRSPGRLLDDRSRLRPCLGQRLRSNLKRRLSYRVPQR